MRSYCGCRPDGLISQAKPGKLGIPIAYSRGAGGSFRRAK
jgi:hypothetical protein